MFACVIVKIKSYIQIAFIDVCSMSSICGEPYFNLRPMGRIYTQGSGAQLHLEGRVSC